MVWSFLSISSRVIAMALFASYQLYWFWGLVVTQVVITTSIIIILWWDVSESCFNCLRSVIGFLFGLGFLVTFIPFGEIGKIHFHAYFMYWTMMFIENTVMVSLWYHWSYDLGLWYQDWAITYVIGQYIVSLGIKIWHSHLYEANIGEKNILKWKFYESEDSRNERIKAQTAETRVENSPLEETEEVEGL